MDYYAAWQPRSGHYEEFIKDVKCLVNNPPSHKHTRPLCEPTPEFPPVCRHKRAQVFTVIALQSK